MPSESRSPSPVEKKSTLQWLWSTFKHYLRTSWLRYRKLHIYSKLALWALMLFYAALGAFLITVGADRIGQTMYDLAQKISNLRFGWMILGAILVVISFPPCIGHTTTVTLCGFAYGMNGFFIAAGGSLVGAVTAFAVLRMLFSRRLKKWSGSNEKWQALEAVVEAKGLPLIMLIRASPFPPWVYANSLFASIQTVALWQFAVATVVVFPKVALHVFIGSRLASLSDGETRRQMDPQTKAINIAVVVLGVVIAILTSFIIYRSMQTHIRHLQGISPAVDELAAEAVEEAGEGAPLLHSYSDESFDEERTIRPARSVSPNS
ncbi:Golgi apparatus membrane protein TVP38 [Cristinia sonorae]|uniref:Golgi apparatus membrane protein TVP38 n=1 Tax=Cristinia sonorae TaxID=1940300 RepID=A0A8K0UW22_9AGAR|nr:Golgi apparatus membrane protein TVP38 [Cristinia sonorae]